MEVVEELGAKIENMTTMTGPKILVKVGKGFLKVTISVIKSDADFKDLIFFVQ